MVKFPESLEDLMKIKPRRHVRAIVKRDGAEIESFDVNKISDAVGKASHASGKNYSAEETNQFSLQVMAQLESAEKFSHSRGDIPHVNDVQDAVLETFKCGEARKAAHLAVERLGLDFDAAYQMAIEIVNEYDPTGAFYARYKEGRDRVRENLVNLPFELRFDSTDKQLQVDAVQNGKPHQFNKDALMVLILERTNVAYDDARSAVKRVEEVLAQRKSTTPIGTQEIIAVIDAALMEKGYTRDNLVGGRQMSITLDDVEQMIMSRSVENSNIKSNNPEAVNLGIAELVLKELALRKVFDEDVASSHRNGEIHIHDLGYPQRVYCSAHSIEYFKKYGLDVVLANLDAKSSRAKRLMTLNNHVHTVLAAIQAFYAGALGFPMLNTLYGPAALRTVEMIEGEEIIRDNSGQEILRKRKRLSKETLEKRVEEGDINEGDFIVARNYKIIKSIGKKDIKHGTQNLIFGAAQSAFSRGGQTLFIDFNIDSATPEHVVNVPATFLEKLPYKRVKKNQYGEYEVVEEADVEPKRYEGLTINRGKKDADGKPISEPDPRNGDVIQPEDGSLWLTYGHEIVEGASQDFGEAILEVAEKGDRYGNMFNFPKIDFHVGRRTFQNQRALELLKRACQAVQKNDSVYFLFDRGDGMNVAQCCRLRERITDPAILKHPEKIRFCGFQNVSINLPQAGFRASGDTLEQKINSTLEEIDKVMILALKAHTNKRRYVQTLLDTDGSPMRPMGRPSDDGEPYIDLIKATYIIGLLGLNELVKNISGEEMHESALAYKTGLRILSHINSIKNEFTRRYGMKFVIEETPGESANRRLAKIDLARYGEKAKKVVKGNIEADEVYYTNSSHLSAEAPVSGLDRARLQGKMNPMIEAGAITHFFTGERQNNAEAVFDALKSIFYNTQSSQVVWSGEHTVCLCCKTHTRGLIDKCPECGNDDAEKLSQKTRTVGYFSDPRQWHRSKKGELKARKEAQDFYAGVRDSLKDLEAELLTDTIEPGKLRIAVIGKKGCDVCDNVFDAALRYVNSNKLPEQLRSKVDVVKYDVETDEGRVFAAIYDAPIDSYPSVVVHYGDRFEMFSSEYPYMQKPTIPTAKNINDMVENISGSSEASKIK